MKKLKRKGVSHPNLATNKVFSNTLNQNNNPVYLLDKCNSSTGMVSIGKYDNTKKHCTATPYRFSYNSGLKNKLCFTSLVLASNDLEKNQYIGNHLYNISTVYPEKKFQFALSDMGSGKTEAAKQFKVNRKESPYITISHLVGLVLQSAKRYETNVYSDLKDKVNRSDYLELFSNCSTTIQSLPKMVKGKLLENSKA